MKDNKATNANATRPAQMKDRISTTAKNFAQKSQDLYRKTAQKPIGRSMDMMKKVGRTMDIARGKARTMPINVPKPDATTARLMAISKPAKIKATTKTTLKPTAKTPALPTAKPVNDDILKKVIEKPAKDKTKRHIVRNILITCATLAIITIVFVYLYLPSFSVIIASAQAGIDATYPEYQPEGFHINGPVSYSDGQVTIKFHADKGDEAFSIKQSRSSWDSSAVKAEAEKSSVGEISTTSERGLTIYSYDNNAMWVNGGILYAITGDAPLSGDQIRRIATSL